MFTVGPRDRFVDSKGDPVVTSPFATLTNYNISIFYLLWHFVITHWNLANYVAWVRYNDSLLGEKPSIGVYLAFVVIGTATFWLVCGPMFFYTAKYRKNAKDRNLWLSAGIALAYFMMDIPMWMLDVSIWYYHGARAFTQTTALVLRSLSFFVNTFVTWHFYMHRMSKLLHRIWGTAAELREVAQRESQKQQRSREGYASSPPRAGGGSW